MTNTKHFILVSLYLVFITIESIYTYEHFGYGVYGTFLTINIGALLCGLLAMFVIITGDE